MLWKNNDFGKPVWWRSKKSKKIEKRKKQTTVSKTTSYPVQTKILFKFNLKYIYIASEHNKLIYLVKKTNWTTLSVYVKLKSALPAYLTHTDDAIEWSTHALNESYWHVKKCFQPRLTNPCLVMKRKTITQKSQNFQSLKNEQLYYVRSVLIENLFHNLTLFFLFLQLEAEFPSNNMVITLWK